MLEAIAVEKLTKRYGSRAALDAVTLTIPQGAFACILGPSGCGKSTLLNVISGLVEHDEGQIRLGGEVIARGTPPESRGLGMMFQTPTLFPHMNVFDNVAFPLRVRGVPPEEVKQLTWNLLELAHVADRARMLPHMLSGGQQQRVALCRALVFQPRAVLLDEPLSALDRPLRDALQRELREIQRSSGAAFVMVTHDREEAMALADLVFIMRDGCIEQAGSPADIYHAPVNRFVAEFFAASTVITGLVESRGSGWSVVAQGGLVIHEADGTPPSATPIEVVVRPEQVQVLPPSEGAVAPPGSSTARVIAVRFGGSSSLIALEADAGRIMVRIATRTGRLPATGDIVDVTIEKRNTFALKPSDSAE